jgi:hypothetical protein
MTISVPINARMMIAGKKFCFAKFLDQTTVERVQNPDAICGNRDPLLQRTASGRRKVMFSTFHDITVPILQELLPICGMTLATGTYTANQSAQSTITIIVDKVAAVHKYTVCRMTRMIIRGQTGTLPCSIECQWIAEDEIEDSGTSWVDGTVDNIIAFPGATYEINGTAVDFDRFAFVIDNKLIPSWNSSVTVTDVGNGPRQTLLATSVPYIAGTKDLYWDFRDAITADVDHSLEITNGSDSLTFNLPNAVLIPESPPIEGALEEIRLPMTWEAHRSSSVAAFNLVLVSA